MRWRETLRNSPMSSSASAAHSARARAASTGGCGSRSATGPTPGSILSGGIWAAVLSDRVRRPDALGRRSTTGGRSIGLSGNDDSLH